MNNPIHKQPTPAELAMNILEAARRLRGFSNGRTPEFQASLQSIESDATRLLEALDADVANSLASVCRRVLVVEDSEVSQIVAQRFLLKLGCQEVDIAPGGGQALELLAKNSYDLVIMDLEMPGMDGCEAVRRLRSGEAGDKASSTPVIALTGHVRTATRASCIEGGMNGFLTKPLTFENLQAALADCFGLHRSNVARSRDDRCGRCETSSPLLDRAAAMANMDGDEAIYRDLLSMFMIEQPATLQEARDAFARNDLESVRNAAHKMKNLYKAVGAMSCGALSGTMESAAKVMDYEEARNTFNELERESERLMPLLQA